MSVYDPVDFFMSFLTNFISRMMEFQADQFSVRCGNGVHLKEALININKSRMSSITLHPIYIMVHQSHPTLVQRLEAIDMQSIELKKDFAKFEDNSEADFSTRVKSGGDLEMGSTKFGSKFGSAEGLDDGKMSAGVLGFGNGEMGSSKLGSGKLGSDRLGCGLGQSRFASVEKLGTGGF